MLHTRNRLPQRRRERADRCYGEGREGAQWGAEYLNEFSHPREDDDDDDDDDTMMAKGDRIEIRQKRRNGEERREGG